MSQYDLMLDLKIKVGHCDLYFMVQCSCSCQKKKKKKKKRARMRINTVYNDASRLVTAKYTESRHCTKKNCYSH